jgi:hypothetical protein
MRMKETSIIWIWRGFLATISIAILIWLFWQNLVPTGILVLNYSKGSAVSPITDLHPEKRIIELSQDDDNQRFYVDPVYFDAKVPREFDTVTVDVKWQNQSQPILELGARKVRGAWGFVLKPLQNKIIDQLDWPCQRYDSVIFCQREKKYENLSSFFSNPQEGVLSYNYVMPENIKHDVMNVNSNPDEYDYIVATYESPKELEDNWYQKSIVYDWQDFALYINEISFLISAPELHKGHGQILVGDIIITLKRDPLDFEGFIEYGKNQLRRLKN